MRQPDFYQNALPPKFLQVALPPIETQKIPRTNSGDFFPFHVKARGLHKQPDWVSSLLRTLPIVKGQSKLLATIRAVNGSCLQHLIIHHQVGSTIWAGYLKKVLVIQTV